MVYLFPPTSGWCKINTDWAGLANGQAACGVILRDHIAWVLACFSAPFGVHTAFWAELLAVVHVVEKVIAMNLSFLWVECDALLVVNCLVGHLVSVLWCVRHRWQRCIDSFAQVHYRFSHIYREGNKVSDYLSSLGFGLTAPYWWGDDAKFCYWWC